MADQNLTLVRTDVQTQKTVRDDLGKRSTRVPITSGGLTAAQWRMVEQRVAFTCNDNLGYTRLAASAAAVEAKRVMRAQGHAQVDRYHFEVHGLAD